MTELLLGVEALALLVLAPVSLLSARYLRRIYLRSPAPRVPLFKALVTSDSLAAGIGAYFAYTIIARVVRPFVDVPTFPPPWSTVVAGALVILLFAAPTAHAMSVRRMRRP